MNLGWYAPVLLYNIRMGALFDKKKKKHWKGGLIRKGGGGELLEEER